MDRDFPDAYEADFYAWTKTQADALRRAGEAHLNADVDWANVAEEIETLGRSDFRAVRSQLDVIIEHLLKLMLSPAEAPRRGWRKSAANARISLEQDLTRSLRSDLDTALADRYRTARKRAARGLLEDDLEGADVPDQCPWTLDQLLDEEFWPKNRHGHGWTGA